MAYAAIISRGIRSFPMLKCSSDRCVCAPHSLLLGTSTSPRLSVSLRTLITFTLLMALIGFLPSICLFRCTLGDDGLRQQAPANSRSSLFRSLTMQSRMYGEQFTGSTPSALVNLDRLTTMHE